MINCSQSLFVHSKLMLWWRKEITAQYTKGFPGCVFTSLVGQFFFFPLVWNATSHHCSLEIKHQFIKIGENGGENRNAYKKTAGWDCIFTSFVTGAIQSSMLVEEQKLLLLGKRQQDFKSKNY